MVLSARPLAAGGEATPDLILLAIEDVTERKRREEALVESESKLRAIVDAAAVGIVTIDEAGTIVAFNRAAERIFGHPASEVIGQNVSILMPSPYRDEHPEYVARYLRTGLARIIGKSREVVGRRKDGTTFPMELSIGEWHDGVTRGFVGIVRDISERKKAEEETARHQVELGRALRLGAMGELAAGLAHELNQPLSVVANILGTCVTRLRSRPGASPDADPAPRACHRRGGPDRRDRAARARARREPPAPARAGRPPPRDRDRAHGCWPES